MRHNLKFRKSAFYGLTRPQSIRKPIQISGQTILPSVESLWSSLQGEVYFMGGSASAAEGLVTSPIMVTILDFTKN